MNSTDRPGKETSRQAPLALLTGGGEMGERTRAFEWSKTPVGPVADWPQSLKTAVQIMLNSRYPMFLAWGRRLTFFYNDAYIPVLGQRHPAALGMSAAEVWSEIWSTLGPQAQAVMDGAGASWCEEQLLLMERNQFLEETYFTYSYSPIPDDGGGVGGVFCACTEDTHRVLSQRRLRTLRALAEQATQAKSVHAACGVAAATMGGNPHDLPFALLYLLDGEGKRATVAGFTGLSPATPACPASVDLDDPEAPWPFRQVAEGGKTVEVTGLPEKFGPLPGGAWPDSPKRAVVLPMTRPGQTRLAGIVVAAVSARLDFNDEYKGFFDLIAGHVATAVANARAYEEERQRAEALAELDRAKTAFFSNVSHEFRTPLTLLLGPVEEALADAGEPLTPRQQERLEVARRNALRLQKLVNTLLDFSRIEAGRVQACFEPVDLAAFTCDLASNFRSACEKAGLELALDCPPLSEPVFVDRQMWEKVVLNLLSNAFKFTFAGGITVSLRRAGRAAELRVRDTGTGIAAEEMPRLFERFHRVENARGRTHEGSGIGLALVQELVRLHGGTITAESEVGAGTTFNVSVPLGNAHLPPDRVSRHPSPATATTGAAPFVEEALRWLPDAAVSHGSDEEMPGCWDDLSPAPPAAQAGGDRPRVLVADDNADMRQYVVRLLAGRYEVEAVPDGEAALAAVRRRTPDLILTDVMMPRLDGFGLLRELRAGPRTATLPVILLSARAGEESRVEGMGAGADDYLVKPFSARELLARVSAHLQMARLRRESNKALRKSEERFRLAADAVNGIIYEYDLQTGHVERTRGLSEALGYRPDEVPPTADWWWEQIHPDDRPRIQSRIEGELAAGRNVLSEYRVRHKDGRWLHVEDRAVLLKDAKGRPVKMVGCTVDVTERKQIEQSLRDGEERYRATVEHAAVGVSNCTPDGRFMYANRKFCEIIGYTLDELLQTTWQQLTPPGDLEAELSLGQRVRTGQMPAYTMEKRYVRKDGSLVWVSLSGSFVHDAEGQERLGIGVIVDITARKRAEEESRRSQEIFRLVHQIGKVGHWEWNSLTDENKWSPEIQALYGLKPGTFEGTYEAWAKLVHPDDLPRAEEDVRRALETGVYFTEFRVIWPDGSVHWLEARANVFKDGHDKPVRIMGVNMDITERKRQEEALREADRRKDEFLATLAHELRNPLAPIRNAVQYLRMKQPSDPELQNARDIIDRQVQQMTRLVDDLLDVSRISQGKINLQKQRVSLALVVSGAVEASRPWVEAHGHHLTVKMLPHPVYVEGDPTRLEQVFLNLLNNAAKYTPKGGQIVLIGQRQGSDMVVSVRDNGVGIPADKLPGLFEMFSQVEGSLSRSQGGLGIGLHLVKRLVEMHGGSITAHSDGPGKGSEFVVRLPVLVEARGPLTPTEKDETAVLKSSLRILIVDDNKDGADSLGMMLRLMGNDTRTAYDGEEAVSAAGEFRPDVALLDIGLPKLNGYEACRRIREQPWGKQMVLIAVTGWGQDEDRHRSHKAGFDNHMVKPVDPQALMKRLAELQRVRT